MVTVATTIEAPVADVFAVLADGGSYDRWVVGCRRIRDLDARWPEPGAVLHHTVGLGPVVVDDTTTVLECEPPYRLVLRASAGAVGAARVTFELDEDGDATYITMTEVATEGPARYYRGFASRVPLEARNLETLRRLGRLAVRRHG